MKGVSLSVKSGEFVVLLGPSGSGKTTLLRCIAGLEKPDAGSVFIGGELADGLLPRERDIGMVFQSYALFPLMTVKDNIAFPLKVRGMKQEEIDAKVKQVADRLGIPNLLGKFPKQLSGGEQQRVAIGRAIVRDVSVLLMDEPLSSLDAPLRAQLRTELKTLQRELGTTVIYVTHDQVEAMTLADQMGVVDSGVLLQYGSPKELYSHPLSSFVARFVGTPGSNLVHVVASRRGGALFLQAEGTQFVLPPTQALATAIPDGGKYILAIRPEGISLSRSKGKDSFQATVRLIEPLGSSTVLDVVTGKVQLKVLVAPSFNTSVGEALWGSFDPETAHLFDEAEDSPV